MLGSGLPRKPGAVCVVLDPRLSRERTALLNRVINTVLRTFTTVEVLSEKTTEEKLLQAMESKKFDLAIVPWHSYLEWNRAEAFWGASRTSGPTLVGYFAEPLPRSSLGECGERMRGIFLDFMNLSGKELSLLVKTLQKDELRSGLRPLVDPDAKIYVENWYGSQGLGSRIDSILGLPEFTADPRWAARGNAMRICINAFWSLVYEEGPGKGAQAATSSPKAYFQVACDRETAIFRICYQMPNWTPKAALANFWPSGNSPTSATQLILQYADFARVHTFTNSPEIEIVAGFVPSAPSEYAHGQLHTLWIEPLAETLFSETPGEAPGPANPRLRPLANASQPQDTALRAVSPNVIELEAKLKEKESQIQELRAGGVGTAGPLPPPEPEQLIEAFQERYFDARFQIRQLELEIVAMETRGATDEEITNIRQKMEALANRERVWIKKLADTLATYKSAKRK